uniref:Uncharacterized protein n=1 Tax=Candidatus Kentrum sp. TC TaxID=2126339 RepID=A0A450ZTT8_9GAMM|nr:MAG: hypothetical protein BECKTC1821F_GA0114240_101538 [Candidatus Kentron sp. TC]
MPAATQQLTLEEIAEYMRAHMVEWLTEDSLAKPPAVYEIELRERMVRVEEELKHQRELMKQGFDLMGKRLDAMNEENNKRFEAMSQENNRRFEEINRRFEAMSRENNRRFEEINGRFEEVNGRFEEINGRFEEINRRFEAMSQENNRRFEAVERHFESMLQRTDRFMIWSLGTTIGMGSLVIAILKFSL